MSDPSTEHRRIDLNADLGEDCGDDQAMLGIVTSANVCCGVHAGDPLVTWHALTAAVEAGVRVGAHPSYPDRANFGRTSMRLDARDLHAVLGFQLAGFAALNGGRIDYVKAHGALYNDVFADAELAAAIVYQAAQHAAAVMHMPDSAVDAAATSLGVRFIAEAFADRAYAADGSLVPRSEPGAVLDATAAARQALEIVTTGSVTTIDGTVIDCPAQSLCVHGDTPGAVELTRAVRAALEAEGVIIEPVPASRRAGRT